MYKIFKITYNDGGWHSGDLPHFFYIAECEEHVVTNSRQYKKYIEQQQINGGDIWISEVSGLVDDFYFENLQDFIIKISIQKQD